jgi:outer membrane immunogenic protein
MRTPGKQMISNQTMKRILVTVLFSALAAGAALASDLPPPARVPPRAPAVYAPPPPVYDWTGFYIGINGGWGFGKSDWNTNIGGVFLDTGNFNVNGGLVGGTVGYNWWFGGWVLGLEGDFDGSWIKGSTNTCVAPLGVACQTKNNWLATIRPRVGYAADRVLFYLTGGGAFGNVVVNTTTNWQSADKTGWTAGGGIEGAFTDHWTARVEYLFVDLTNSTFTPIVGTNITTKFNANLIRLGVDYKF